MSVRPQDHRAPPAGNRDVLPLSLPHRLVREQGEIASNGAVSDKTQGFLVAGLRE